MKTTRFQTDQRLWMWIALVLTVACWCFLRTGLKTANYVPVVLLREWIVAIFRADGSAGDIFYVGAALLMFGCVSGIASIVAAWFLHCAVVIARTKRRERKDHA
jgi:hypothetical protein